MLREIRNQVIARVNECFAEYNAAIKGTKLEPVPVCAVEFSSTLGTTSAFAYVNGNRKIVLNTILLGENAEAFMTSTIPHEVAHICVRHNYPNAKQYHGREWRHVMKILGAKPNRMHSYDVSNVKTARDMTKHVFTCKCNINHFLSPQMAKKSSTLMCAKCRGRLSFVANGKESILRQKYHKNS